MMQGGNPSNRAGSERDDTVGKPGLRLIQPAIEHLEPACDSVPPEPDRRGYAARGL